MSAPVFALGLLLLILIIILTGFTCYICRNYCLKKNVTNPVGFGGAGAISSDVAESTLNARRSTAQSKKTLTFDHLYKDQSLEIIKPAEAFC